LILGAVAGAAGFMIVAGLVLGTLLALGGGPSVPFGSRIAVVEIDGLLADDADVLEQIRRFRADPRVKGFLIAINSPGAVVGPAQSVYQEVRRLRAEDGYPVVASIGAIGASGGYYVALGADSIFALPGSLTGSIGVLLEFPDASGLMEKVGVRMQVVKSAELKDAGSPFRPFSETDRLVLGELVTDVYAQFVDAVAEERALSHEAVARVADGRVLSGRQAFEHGLIDRLGNYRDALAAAGRMAGLGDEPRVVRPPRPRFGLRDLILGGSPMDVLSRAVRPRPMTGGPVLKFAVPF
jgi:protease IV